MTCMPPTKKKTGLERSFESSCLPATGGLCADCVYEDRPHPYGTGQATRAISTARLSVLLRLHLQPINVLVSNGPSEGLPPGKIRLEGGFPLRCFQRFSGPNIATRRCPWQDSRYTRGPFLSVLSSRHHISLCAQTISSSRYPFKFYGDRGSAYYSIESQCYLHPD